MPTKAELKQEAQHIKIKLRKGDQVMIIAGKDKGQIGEVLSVSPKEQKAFIVQKNPENPEEYLPLNAAIKHRKARYQGEKSARLRIPVPIHISNVMVLDPKSGEPTRIGRKKVDGKLVRIAKKSGEKIVDADVMPKE